MKFKSSSGFQCLMLLVQKLVTSMSSALGYLHVCLRVQVADAAPHLKRIVSCFSFSDFGGLMSWSSCLPQPVPQNVGEVSVFFGQQKCQDTELRFFGDGAISPGTLQARNLV